MARKLTTEIEGTEQVDVATDAQEAPVEKSAKKAAKPEPKVSLRQKLQAEAAALLSAIHGGRNMSPEQFEEKADARALRIIRALKASAGGYEFIPESRLNQYRYELLHYEHGTWHPGLKAPRDKSYENIAGGPRMPGRSGVEDNPSLDATLEEGSEGA